MGGILRKPRLADGIVLGMGFVDGTGGGAGLRQSSGAGGAWEAAPSTGVAMTGVEPNEPRHDRRSRGPLNRSRRTGRAYFE